MAAGLRWYLACAAWLIALLTPVKLTGNCGRNAATQLD